MRFVSAGKQSLWYMHQQQQRWLTFELSISIGNHWTAETGEAAAELGIGCISTADNFESLTCLFLFTHNFFTPLTTCNAIYRAGKG